MESKTRAQMIGWLLEHIGVKPAAQAARAEDVVQGGRVLDSVYSQLRKEDLAPFPISAVPDWGQMPLIKAAAADCGKPFNLNAEKRAELMAERIEGRRELATQVAGFKPPVPIKVCAY